jgi:hypothetical protein
MEWRLRDRYSSDVIRQNAIYSQRLASAARVLSAARAYIEKVNDDCTEDEDRDEMLAKIDRYFQPNANVEARRDGAPLPEKTSTPLPRTPC